MIYEMAKRYRAIGWNVIPLYNYSKNPAPLAWKVYQDRMATDAEFETWFDDTRVTGLGLITGHLSGIVVLDEDTYKTGGLKVKAKTGMFAKTARGGIHHYFRYVEPIKSSGLREGIYVEIKADGGFVVLPPSKVRVDDGSLGEYTWGDKCMPKVLLSITEEELLPYRVSTDNKSVNVMELRGALFGTQHNSLRSMCLSLFARFKREEWNLAEDVIRMEAARFVPPHPEQRVETMIKDCKEFILTHNDSEVDEEIKAEPMAPRGLNELAAQRVEDRKLEKSSPTTGWPELDDLIKGFIPGHIYTLTGDTNVGKTTIACNFAEALRKQEKKTLYIALEPDVNVVEYLASVRHNKRFDELTDEDLFIEDQYIHVFLQQDIKKVSDLIQALKSIDQRYDLIIIDHIGYFVRSERDWIQQQSNIIKELAFLARDNKSAVMMIAHLRKPGFQKKNQDWVPNQNDISGSAAFKQDSTEVLIAYRPTKPTDQFSITFADLGVLLVTKTKVGPNGNLPLIFAERGAKVWSPKEANNSLAGKMMLEKREIGAYTNTWQKSNEAPWVEKDDS